MRNLLNPKWIFILNTLPVAVLFFIFYREFGIINSLLEEESISLWKTFGWTLGLLWLLNLGCGIFLLIRGKRVSFYYGIIALLCYVPFLYVYGFYSEKIVPFSIPQWMVSGNMFLSVGTFLMPTLAYSLFILVACFTHETKEHKAWKNFLMALFVPITWYFFSQILLPFWKPVDSNFSIHAVLVFIIIGTLLFLFFLIRAVFILATKKAVVWQRYQLAWKIPIAIVFPLVGLSVNNGHLFNDFTINNAGVFGDFNDYWFYVLAIVNGIFICLPNLENRIYRLYLFIGRSITFAYTFYFFIVFLPFLPLSVIAIVAIGVGFLMLSPLLLFVLHINEMCKDFKYLKTYFSGNRIMAFSVAGFLVIPLFITTGYINDRTTLHQTLDYLYSPDYSKSYSIDKASLQNTLDIVKNHKENNRGGIFGSQQPYLSSYFNWLVLDNLTLSYAKINTIERIFFGKTAIEAGSENIRNKEVAITNIVVSSTFDNTQNAWKSWIDLEITNKSENAWFSEYATTIELPEGAWISDYYLYVADKKEMGLLSEKKSAMWVFSNIRNENRDPGILYYLTGNKVAFKVFPFAKDELRKTGIELLHKEPIQLAIDGNIVQLGNSEECQGEGFENENLVYLTAKQKQSLKRVNRTPYFHSIVDVSKKEIAAELSDRIQIAVDQNKLLAENARISFVNSCVYTMPLNREWKQKMQVQSHEGGFYIDRAIKSILFSAYKSNENTYPVMVVVTDNIQTAVFEKDFSDWQFSYPESSLFYNLKENGTLEPHSLTTTPYAPLRDSVAFTVDHSVLEYRSENNMLTYLPDNNKPSIVLKSDQFETDETKIKKKNWESALILQGKWNAQIMHPETSGREWLNLVKSSFLAEVMTPVTSYLVVENEAQKAILKRKQEQLLSGNKSLDLGEDTQRMSEPGLLLMASLLGLVLWYRQRKHGHLMK